MATPAPRPRHLTLEQFREGCASYVGCKSHRRVRRGNGRFAQQEEEGYQDLGTDLYTIGWEWVQHSMLPQLSHLKRVIEVLPPERSSIHASQKHSEEEDLESDPILSSGLSHPNEAQVPTSTTHPPPSTEKSHDIGTGTGIDSTSVVTCNSSTISCTQEIFYSSTWSTPVLYLQAHDIQTGQTLSLEEMMDPHLGVFLPGENGLGFDKTLQEAGRRSTLHPLLPQASSAHRGGDEGAGDTVVLTEPQMQDGTSTLSDEESVAPAYFPPLSLSDHPITSLPCISLHPCQTAVVIGEMMHSREVSGGQDGNGGQEEAVYAKEYLKAFMTICASVVEMRG